jgi:hypothetical protein
VALDPGARDLIMPVEHLAPGAVSKLRGALGGADDVGEEHR